MSAVENVIATLAPGWAAERARARASYERSQLAIGQLRGFHAASQGRRLEDWRSITETGATDPAQHLATIRARSRELRRNNPYWESAINGIVGHTVGHGVRAAIIHPRRGVTQRLQGSWDAWARSSQVDVSGRMNWYAIQSLVMETVAESGECLVRRTLDADGALRLVVLSPDYLSGDRDGPTDRNTETIGGVEVDENGAPVAYHLYRRLHRTLEARETVRVPASEVAHVYRVQRPGQLRGIPWVAPVFTRLVHWDDYEDAELARQKVSACFGVLYHGEMAGQAELPERIEPGMIEQLPPGTDVELVSPPAASGIEPFSRITLRAVAAGLGITYELLTGDLTGVNFSSARMGHLTMMRNVRRWQTHLLIEQLCQRVFGWWAQAEALRPGGLDALRATAEWTAPVREMIDPDKETRSAVNRVRGGLAAWSDVAREQGRDPEQLAQAIAHDNKRFDALGIVLDCDPRRLSQSGQGVTNTKEEDGSGNDETESKAA
jgi:lambda family phage portal protein